MNREYTVTANGLIKMTRKQLKAQDTQTLRELHSRSMAFGGLTASTARMLVKELNQRGWC